MFSGACMICSADCDCTAERAEMRYSLSLSHLAFLADRQQPIRLPYLLRFRRHQNSHKATLPRYVHLMRYWLQQRCSTVAAPSAPPCQCLHCPQGHGRNGGGFHYGLVFFPLLRPYRVRRAG